MAGRQLIMILGMGRSGTSAIAKVLELCGGRLPAAIIPPNFANPKGYWEPEVAVSINDDFLLRHGSSWYDPTMRLQSGDAKVSGAATESFVAAIAAFLRGERGEEPLVIKEPRITGLVPYWIEAAKRERYTVSFVIALREPAEVAQSLLTRDGISNDFSDVLWLKYSLLAERWSRAGPRVVVHFASLVATWESEVDRIRKAIRVDLTPRSHDGDISSFLDVDLYHHRRDAGEREPATLQLTATTYAEMMRAARGGSLDLPALDSTLGRYLVCDRRIRTERVERSSVAPGLPDRESIPAWNAIGARLAVELR